MWRIENTMSLFGVVRAWGKLFATRFDLADEQA